MVVFHQWNVLHSKSSTCVKHDPSPSLINYSTPSSVVPVFMLMLMEEYAKSKEERSSADKRLFLFTSLSFLLLGRDIGLQF